MQLRMSMYPPAPPPAAAPPLTCSCRRDQISSSAPSLPPPWRGASLALPPRRLPVVWLARRMARGLSGASIKAGARPLRPSLLAASLPPHPPSSLLPPSSLAHPISPSSHAARPPSSSRMQLPRPRGHGHERERGGSRPSLLAAGLAHTQNGAGPLWRQHYSWPLPRSSVGSRGDRTPPPTTTTTSPLAYAVTRTALASRVRGPAGLR